MFRWDLLLIFTSIILLGYTYWWCSFLFPYLRRQSQKQEFLPSEMSPGVSVIIPFRNEAHRIKPLLDSIQPLSLTGPIELLFCDDHSEDHSAELIRTFQATCQFQSRLLPVAPGKKGKKAALQLGIESAKYPIIFTTDADCQLHPLCIETMLKQMQLQQANLVLGDVSYRWVPAAGNKSSRSNPLQVYQCVENAVLSAIGWVESQNHNAAVANGANLMFAKSDFLSLGGYQGNEHIGSGDDVFTLEKFLLSPQHKVIHAAHPNAVVYTPYESDFTAFFHQRMRWMKKTFLQKTQKTALKQVLVGLFMVSLWVISGFSVYRGTYETLALVWLGKLLVDSAGVRMLCRTENPNPLTVVWVSALQVFWLPCLAIAALLLPYRWKARPYRA